MNQPDKFSQALKVILSYEGDFVNHPKDPGGATNKGITQRTFDSWRHRKGMQINSVANITESEVSAIYREDFWSPMSCDSFAYPIALILFDTAVHWGVHGALGLIAEALSKPATLPLKSIIASALLSLKAPQALAEKIIAQRKAFRYNRVKKNPSQIVFLQGWLNRDSKLLSLAISSLKATPTK